MTRLKYRVHAPPEEILEALRSRIARERRWPTLLGDRTDLPIVGIVRNDSFRIRRRQRIFNSYAHYLFGTVRSSTVPEDAESTVTTRLGVHPAVQFGIVFQVALAALIFVVVFVASTLSRAPSAAAFMALAVIPPALVVLLMSTIRVSRARDEPALRAWLLEALRLIGPVEEQPLSQT